jgi:non-ribosomal peptide synthetase component E (peptide arylation enzyme)
MLDVIIFIVVALIIAGVAYAFGHAHGIVRAKGLMDREEEVQIYTGNPIVIHDEYKCIRCNGENPVCEVCNGEER